MTDDSNGREDGSASKNVLFLPHLAAGSRAASFPHDCNPELPSRKTNRRQTLKLEVDEQPTTLLALGSPLTPKLERLLTWGE
jgi:hypothetical protein